LQETNAVLIGAQLSTKVGYDGRGLITFFQKIQKADEPASLSMLSNHPMSVERIASIETELKRIKNVPI